jgi:hypothetical protein
MSRRVWIPLLSSLILAGCGDREFGEGKIRWRIETQPTQLDGEQVTLTRGQLDCGTQAELWTIEKLGEDRTVGRLTQKARDLGFGDDVRIDEPGLNNPYVQVRGKFTLSLVQVNDIKDDGPQNKVVDAKVAVRIPNPCFANPLPALLGVKHGQFNEAAGVILRFRMDDDWVYDSILHQ